MTQALPPLSTILVPLDGSDLAERALPVATHLAQATHATLLLARAIPIPSSAALMAAEGAHTPSDIYQELHDEDEHAVTTYLEQQAAPLRTRGVNMLARICVQDGDVVDCLLDIEREERVGLVVMTTHGRTGFRRTLMGSVADQLVRKGQAPVLLLRALNAADQEIRLARAVVALDGSARAERALALSLQLAGGVIRQVQALRVIELPDQTEQIVAAHQYLEGITANWAPRFAEYECDFATYVRIGEPAEQIAQRAEVEGDLIVVATHGRRGLARAVLGSVADQVLRRSSTPLLVVRTGEGAH